MSQRRPMTYRERQVAAAYKRMSIAPRFPVYRGLNRVQRQQVKKLQKKIMELKYHQTIVNNNLDTTWLLWNLTAVPQGDTDISRDGDKISLAGNLSFRCRLIADVSGDAAQQIPNVRFIFFQWHPQSDSAGATVPTIGQIITAGASGSQDETSMYNHDTRQMYTIIYDKVTKLTGPGTSSTNAYNTQISRTFHFELPLYKNKKVRKWMQFLAASTTNATNNIYLAAYASGIPDAQNPLFDFVSKIFFRDP